jgi:osmotically-inducible protein OsmY
MVSGSTVTLRGNVDTWAEREAASGAAWAAPGIGRVVNELRVGAPG